MGLRAVSHLRFALFNLIMLISYIKHIELKEVAHEKEGETREEEAEGGETSASAAFYSRT